MVMFVTTRKEDNKIRVLTNMTRLERAEYWAPHFAFVHHTSAGLTGSLKAFVRSFSCDYILLNGSLHQALLLLILKRAVPLHRAKVVLLDILLSEPKSLRDRMKAWIIGRLLRGAQLIMLYYRDTAGLQRHYRIPACRFRYVPFKVNERELISRTVTTDEGFIFCGGKTRRDFHTLFEAVIDLDCEITVATTANRDINPHGSFLDERTAPTNVEVVRLDGTPEDFISLMAASRLVVLPITPEICGAGISVYLQAMALRKCVIVSAGPGAEDVLTTGQAIIVPPSDPVALREAIEEALENLPYRESVATNGYEWAMSLGGEEQLFASILFELYDDFNAGEGDDYYRPHSVEAAVK